MSKDIKDYCLDLKVIPQFKGTCWLNACLMSALYSQGSKYYVKKVSKSWDKNNSLLNFFKFIIFKMKKHPKTIERIYKKIKPEVILFKLLEQTKNKDIINLFKDNIKYNISDFGYYEHLYIFDLYKYLKLKVLDIFYAPDNNYYCNFNLKYNKNARRYDIDDKSYKKKIQDILNAIPDILVVYNYKINRIVDYIYNFNYINKNEYNIHKNFIKGIDNYEDIIYLNGIKYKLDSVIITNYNNADINKSHAITGITCNNNKYVYNGWSNTSTDPAIIKKNISNNNSPCSLMRYDWDLKKDEEFCLNTKLCKLDFDNIDKTDLCFSFNKINTRRTLIYVRVEEKIEKIKSSTTKEIKEFSNIKEIKEIIADIHDLDNLSKYQLEQLFAIIGNSIPNIDITYLLKPKNKLKLYIKEKLLEYYYNFDNSLKPYIKNIKNIENIDNIDYNLLYYLHKKLNNKYKNLDNMYLFKPKAELLEYLKKVIKDNYESESKSPIAVVKKNIDKSKSPIVIAKKNNKYTKEECDKWKLNKLKNPITNRTIQEGKPAYNDLKKHCIDKPKSPIAIEKKDKSKSPIVIAKKDNKYTKEECDKWKLNKLKNPITNRTIQEGKPAYNDLKKHCIDKPKSPIAIEKKDKSKSPKVVVENKGKYTKEECDIWKVNKLVNPKTNRKIQEGKPVYNDLKKHCL